MPDDRTPTVATAHPDGPTDSVDPDPWARRPHRRRRRVWRIATTIIAAIVVTVLAAAAFVTVPYVIVSPGSATALDDAVVSVQGAPTYHHAGRLLYLTVRVSNEDPNLYRYLFAKLDDDVSVEKREEASSGSTSRRRNSSVVSVPASRSRKSIRFGSTRCG